MPELTELDLSAIEDLLERARAMPAAVAIESARRVAAIEGPKLLREVRRLREENERLRAGESGSAELTSVRAELEAVRAELERRDAPTREFDEAMARRQRERSAAMQAMDRVRNRVGERVTVSGP